VSWLLVRDGALGDGLLTLPLLCRLMDTGPGVALLPGALTRWLRPRGWPVARLDDPRWLALWAEGAVSEELHEALGGPSEAVVVGQPRVAQALLATGIRVREVAVDPPPGVHQAAWLLGEPLDPRRVEVPLVEAEPDPAAPDVVLLPGSGGLRKCWPAARFAELGRRLRRSGRTVQVVLGPAELDRGPRPDAFAGLPVLEAPDLARTAALCAGAGVVVGNDAGTTHLAAAVGARVVALFGPTDPVRWRPLGDRVQVVRGELRELGEEVVLAHARRCQTT